jgi:putative sigma-54 modulation protein
MQAEYTGRQVTITPALRRLGDEAIERIAKVLPKVVGAHIVLTSEKYRKTADVAVKMRAGKIVGFAESNNTETALREALERAETQAIRYRKRLNAIKRQPKEEKLQSEVLPVRPRRASRTRAESAEPETTTAAAKTNGKGAVDGAYVSGDAADRGAARGALGGFGGAASDDHRRSRQGSGIPRPRRLRVP